MRIASVRASQLPLRLHTMSLIDDRAAGINILSICTSTKTESVALPPRICGFEFPEDAIVSQSPSTSSSCTRSSSIPESPLGRELRNAGLVGLPALPKLKLKVFTQNGPSMDHATTGLRGFQSMQHLPSLSKHHLKFSSCEAPIGCCSSSPCETPSPFPERSSPIDTPRWVLKPAASLVVIGKTSVVFLCLCLLMSLLSQERCLTHRLTIMH